MEKSSSLEKLSKFYRYVDSFNLYFRFNSEESVGTKKIDQMAFDSVSLFSQIY